MLHIFGMSDWCSALPDEATTRHATGAHPRARIGWSDGLLTVADALLELPDAVRLDAPLAEVAGRMAQGGAGLLPVTDESGRLLGAIDVEQLLEALAHGDTAKSARSLLTVLVPACRPDTTLADAIRQMVTCYVRRLPVVASDGRLLGQLPLAEAVANADRDPALRDLLESLALSPSLWARRWR
jgi:CBS-domain-containing membrane protein